MALTHLYPLEMTIGQMMTNFCCKALSDHICGTLIFLSVLGVSQVCLMYLHRQYAHVSSWLPLLTRESLQLLL